MIDKINDEFIVDCTNNSKEERQQVYKFLVDNGIHYLTNDYPIIACNKISGQTNWVSLIQYYNWAIAKKDIPVYTFEQFKEMYLNENDMKTYTIQELRNAPIQIKVYSQEQAIKLGYAVGQKTDWKPFEAIYPIYCYLNGFSHPTWNSSENERKSGKPTTIEFNQIEDFMEDKKIIGYKLIKPEYRQAALGLIPTSVYLSSPKLISKEGNNYLDSTCPTINNLRKAGVLDLWFEPVYEEKKQIIKMHSSNKGEFEIEIIDGKAYYRPENKELPKEWIKSILDSFRGTLTINGTHPYKIVSETKINIGCMENCRKEDWEKVYKLLK